MDTQPTEQSISPNYFETPKFNEWARLFMDASNRETYGNAGKSALKAYNTSNMNSAYVIGAENLKKLKSMASIYAENKGYGFGKMIDIAIKKMEKSNDVRWWERLMKLFGYIEEFPHTVIPIQINNQNKDAAQEQQRKELCMLANSRLAQMRQQSM